MVYCYTLTVVSTPNYDCTQRASQLVRCTPALQTSRWGAHYYVTLHDWTKQRLVA